MSLLTPTLAGRGSPIRWCLVFAVLVLGACGGETEGPEAPLAETASGPVLREVPGDFTTIQEALDASADGDTVLVAPGVWRESLSLPPAAVTLASYVVRTGDSSVVAETVIDGGGRDWVVRADSAAGHSRILGLTLRNANDCVRAYARLDFVGGIITDCLDGIAYRAGSGGRLARSRLFENRDDGVDLQGDLVVLMEQNLIRGNGEDGVEMHFHPYRGALVRTVIRGNTIRGNAQDGIQFIAYAEPSSREVLVEGNDVTENGMAGIGCMDGGSTAEDYRSAVIEEVIVFLRNRLSDNGRDMSCGYLTTQRVTPGEEPET
jgi:hypothetical protein